jgi:cytochrome c oxidase subunit 2
MSQETGDQPPRGCGRAVSACACIGAVLPGLFAQVASSAIDPAGIQAVRIARLWWMLLAICGTVYVLVIAALTLAAARRRRAEDPASRAGEDRRITRVVAAGVGITAVLLIAILATSATTARGLASLDREGALRIRVIGNQWWWKIEYEAPDPSSRFETANEIHLPVGRPVVLELQSSDVIHSLWVPNLHGKRDLIPGQLNTLWLQADREGVYRGQCAEYCGLQHAHMGILVVAEAPEKFEAWREAQRAPAPEPKTDEERRGQEVLLSRSCVFCHTVRGTHAVGKVGPDLTHVGGRLTLAAGTLPNTRGHLAGWIADSQHVKPGNYMPQNPMDGGDLQALVSYLQALD